MDNHKHEITAKIERKTWRQIKETARGEGRTIKWLITAAWKAFVDSRGKVT